MPNLPSHASPLFSPRPYIPQDVSGFNLTHKDDVPKHPPPTLISPAFTPPSTPGSETPSQRKSPRSIPVDTSSQPPPRLLDQLPQVECVVRARIPTTSGSEMFLHLYHNNVDDKEHLAIVFGSNIRSRSLDAPRPGETEMDRMIRGAYTGRLHPGRISSRYDPQSPEVRPNPLEDVHWHTAQGKKEALPLVRIHSECYTGETAWSARCDCGEQLDEAARLMSLSTTQNGVIVYLRQEGRGIGLGEKLKAYNLQDLGNDTVQANLMLRHPADARSYGLATAMLMDLGLGGQDGIKLLTNNPDKIRAVEGPNREVLVKERMAMVPIAWKTHGQSGVAGKELDAYLRTKIGKMGHMIE
ncbi:GTP cyclohydrolase II [Bacidia gigantensis]|uniref:GTP cyclohydrolase II n=1 Tax=Bacidia gigantensis TaxID=2732470 RepID=UPI001D03BDAF|nr:GTP cyclohydrolase II [Bacidia gigantensis]KAG8526666.1 GTP cyclohydrolase II [Bacidia gigantensis]